MGCFAAGHLCYLALFARRRTRRALALAAGYGLLLALTLVPLWPDLPAELRVPVAVYSLLLAAMAYRASGLGVLAGAGGAFFLVSDTLIATGVAEWPRPPAVDLWIMLTYLAAQALLTAGVLRAARRPAPDTSERAARSDGPLTPLIRSQRRYRRTASSASITPAP